MAKQKTDMRASFEGDDLVIRLHAENPPKDVGNEKTLQIATSHGNRPTQLTVTMSDGTTRNVIIGVNAYVYRQPKTETVQVRSLAFCLGAASTYAPQEGSFNCKYCGQPVINHEFREI